MQSADFLSAVFFYLKVGGNLNQNWIVENLNNAFSTWNGKLGELWGLVTTGPQTFKGGAVWSVMQTLHNGIEVSVLRDEAYADGDAKLYVSIINTSLPVHIEKDCIATTKLEPHLHGFGLPCAKELLRRNNAFYTMDYHDGAFQFCFEWPDVACNSCVHA